MSRRLPHRLASGIRTGLAPVLGSGVLRTARGPIVRNAGSLYGSTIMTSALGFFFWFLAARLLTPDAVGTASAVLSVCQVLAEVAIFGLGTLTIAQLAERKDGAREIISSASMVAGVSGAIFGFIGALVLVQVSPAFRVSLSGVEPVAIVAALTSATTVGLLLDDAAIGLLRGGIQLRRNLVFATGKLVLLPVLAIVWYSRGGVELLSAWGVATIVSLAAVARRFHAATAGHSWRPSLKGLSTHRRTLYAHHWLNVSMLLPRQLLPVLVATIVSPAANAGFYGALLVVGAITVIPSQLSTALFALKSGDDAALSREVRGSMAICLVLACASAPVFIVFGGSILGVFRGSYVSAAPAMAVLGLTTLPAAVRSHYVAIARVHDEMRAAAIRTTTASCGEIGAAVAGGLLYGTTGVALGVLGVQIVESAFFAPSVVRTLRR